MAQLKPPIHKTLKASDVKSGLLNKKTLAVLASCLVVVGIGFGVSQIDVSSTEQVAAKTAPLRLPTPDAAGLIVPQGFVKGTSNTTHKVDEIFADYSFSSRAARTYEMTFATRRDDCAFAGPQAGAKITHVRLGNARLRSAIRAMSDADMRREINELQLYNATNATPRSIDELAKAPGLRRVDVAVTDTSAPQYLILEALEEGTVWNILPAPGVSIERIAVVAPGTSGVAVGAGVPVEGIDLDLTPECRNAIRAVTNGEAPAVYADSALQLVVGGLPAAPMTYTPLDGRVVQILENDVIFAPLDAEQGAVYFRALYLDLLNKG